MQTHVSNDYPRLATRFAFNGLVCRVASQKLCHTYKNLSKRYAEPWRKYHTLGHIEFCMQILDEFRGLAHDLAQLELAIFYHDVIYDIVPKKISNEEASVEYAARDLRGFGVDERSVLLVEALVMSTTHDHVPPFNDGKLIVDIDLAGLGQPWDVFLKNNENVREEYKHVPEDVFRAKNGEILQRFLDRTPLYYFPEIEAKYGAQAKDNLRRWFSRP